MKATIIQRNDGWYISTKMLATAPKDQLLLFNDECPIHKDFYTWASEHHGKIVDCKIVDVWCGGRMNHGTMVYETSTIKQAVPAGILDLITDDYAKMPIIQSVMTMNQPTATELDEEKLKQLFFDDGSIDGKMISQIVHILQKYCIIYRKSA